MCTTNHLAYDVVRARILHHLLHILPRLHLHLELALALLQLLPLPLSQPKRLWGPSFVSFGNFCSHFM